MKRVVFSLSVFLISVSSYAGFLEMPKVTEVPEFEEETLQLDVDIPPVRDRDPDPEGGVRINVKEFRVQGLAEFPELGITREALAQRVEALRISLMGEDQILESGYRQDEIAELADKVKEIEDKTKDRYVDIHDLQDFVFFVREQMRSRGVTIGMIETVAQTITAFYREKGFILATAYIPEQEVRDGVVVLTLLLGELGEVKAKENKRYPDSTIKRVFNNKLYKPVTNKDVVERLYLINDLPGLTVRGYFEPGDQVGDTTLNIETLKEELISGNIRLDNHGSESTGKTRAYADLFLHNPLGWSDQIQIGVLNSFDPENTTYGLFRYNSFILGPRWRLSAGISSNDFVSTSAISGAILEANGKSLVSDASLGYFFKRGRKNNFSTSLTYTEIKTEMTVAEVSQPDTTVVNTRLGFNFDLLNEKSRALHVLDFGWVQSDSTEEVLQAEGTVNIDESYSLYTFDYSLLKIAQIPFTQFQTKFLAEINGQYAGERQQSVNQFSLTGPKRARGFEVNRFFSDDGIRVGLEWVFQFPRATNFKIFGNNFTESIQPYLLADVAYGVSHPFESVTSVLEDEVTATFSSVGLGFKLSFGQSLGGDLAISIPQTEDISNQDESTTTGTNVYFSLQYSF